MEKNSADRFVPMGVCLLIAAFLIFVISYRTNPTAEPVRVLSVPSSVDVQSTTAATLTEQVDSTSHLESETVRCDELNAASATDLMRVEGIGEALAGRVIAYREANGDFTQRSQLLQVEGIGEALMVRIMCEFYIEGELPVETVAVTETKMPTETTMTTIVTAGRYNLNEVTKEELLLIPQMTEALADGILELRELIQYYTHLYEVLYVEGMEGAYVDNVLAKHLYVELPEVTLIHP